jgi:hypothetical protein
MHGQCPRNLDEEMVNNEQLYLRLKFGDIKGETVSKNSDSSRSSI